MTRKRSVKRKVEIVFDPEKRKEFLTGFRKRKNERRKKAKDELDRNLKEERKRIRQEVKDGYKHMKKSYEPLKELTEKDKANEDEYEDDDVKVKIIELSPNDLAAQNNLLGANQGQEDTEQEQSESEPESVEPNTNCIPGMDFDVNSRRRKRKPTAGDSAQDDGNQPTPAPKKSKSTDHTKLELTSKKDLDRFKKTKTMKQLKKSKLFRQKERIDKQANQKKAKRDKNNMMKSLPKNQRKKKVFEPSRYRKGRLLNRKEFRKMKQT